MPKNLAPWRDDDFDPNFELQLAYLRQEHFEVYSEGKFNFSDLAPTSKLKQLYADITRIAKEHYPLPPPKDDVEQSAPLGNFTVAENVAPQPLENR